MKTWHVVVALDAKDLAMQLNLTQALPDLVDLFVTPPLTIVYSVAVPRVDSSLVTLRPLPVALGAAL